MYNPAKKTTQGMYAQTEPKNETKTALASINPGAPTGLEPAPKDW